MEAHLFYIMFFYSISICLISFHQPRQVGRHGGAVVRRLKRFQWRVWLPQQGDYAVSFADPNRKVLSPPLLVTSHTPNFE